MYTRAKIPRVNYAIQISIVDELRQRKINRGCKLRAHCQGMTMCSTVRISEKLRLQRTKLAIDYKMDLSIAKA
jgi:hypothetical protein